MSIGVYGKGEGRKRGNRGRTWMNVKEMEISHRL